MSKAMLTTVDNPYNPFDQWEKWLMYDNDTGYNSCAYLARIAHTSDELSDSENEDEINRAIDEIIRYDPFNLYRKVTKSQT